MRARARVRTYVRACVHWLFLNERIMRESVSPRVTTCGDDDDAEDEGLSRKTRVFAAGKGFRLPRAVELFVRRTIFSLRSQLL